MPFFDIGILFCLNLLQGLAADIPMHATLRTRKVA